MYKNVMVIHDDYAEIVICDKDKREKDRVLISLEDIDEVGKYKWCTNGRGYVCNRNQGYLHQFIMNPPKGMVVDHKNHNKLDNRRDNLRICTQAENSKNTSMACTNRTGYKGVSYDKGMRKFRASIYHNNKKIYLGCYEEVTTAAIVYDKKAIEFFGKYANINFNRDYYIIMDDNKIVTYDELIDLVIEELGGINDEPIDYSNINNIPDIF